MALTTMYIWIGIATLAITLTAIQLIPQVIKSLKTKKTRDLSLGLIIIVLSGAFLWIIYGIYIQDIPVIIANILNLVAALILLILKILGVI